MYFIYIYTAEAIKWDSKWTLHLSMVGKCPYIPHKFHCVCVLHDISKAFLIDPLLLGHQWKNPKSRYLCVCTWIMEKVTHNRPGINGRPKLAREFTVERRRGFIYSRHAYAVRGNHSHFIFLMKQQALLLLLVIMSSCLPSSFMWLDPLLN